MVVMQQVAENNSVGHQTDVRLCGDTYHINGVLSVQTVRLSQYFISGLCYGCEQAALEFDARHVDSKTCHLNHSAISPSGDTTTHFRYIFLQS